MFSTVPLVSISPKLLRLMELMVKGLSDATIAEDLNTTVYNVRCMQETPKFQKMWHRMVETTQLEVKRRLQAISVKAVDTVVDVMQPQHPARVRLAAAQDVLDRTGFGVRKEQVNQFQVNIAAETLNMAFAAAREAGLQTPYAQAPIKAQPIDAGHSLGSGDLGGGGFPGLTEHEWDWVQGQRVSKGYVDPSQAG